MYKHHITVTNSNVQYPSYTDFYSSDNTPCDSLTDLKTYLGDTFCIGLYGGGSAGSIGNFVASYLTHTAAYGILVGSTVTTKSYDYTFLTITDTVTTI